MASEKKPPVLPDDAAARLAESIAPLAPPAERAAAIKARVLERVRGTGNAQFVTVHAGEGRWVQIAPGVQSKVLHDDGRSRSFLLRLEPGARLPAHGHAGEEACVVLEGSAQLGGVEVHAGDFHLALAGSVHGEVTSRTGALLFLHAASGARA
jgi:anti-sigma factor ChrR (cupin superfamily)